MMTNKSHLGLTWYEDVTKRHHVEIKNNDILAYIKRTEFLKTKEIIRKRLTNLSEVEFSANHNNKNGYILFKNIKDQDGTETEVKDSCELNKLEQPALSIDNGPIPKKMTKIFAKIPKIIPKN